VDRCNENMELLAAFVDRELGEKDRARVEEHLDACADCRRELEALKRVDAMFRAASAPEVSAREWDEMSAALDGAMSVPTHRDRERSSRGGFGGWALSAAALAAAAVITAVFLLGSGPKTEPPGIEITDLETGPNYDATVTLPAQAGDFLVIDITYEK
jgi:anti-sigma factor RsiW